MGQGRALTTAHFTELYHSVSYGGVCSVFGTVSRKNGLQRLTSCAFGEKKDEK
jgi:hypothetical protein